MDNNFDDLEYISRVLQGETKAFEVLIEKYQLLIKKLAYNYLHHTEDVLDASQDIFVEIYKSLPRFDLSKGFLPWLYSVALNTLKKKYRKIKGHTLVIKKAQEQKREDIEKNEIHNRAQEDRMVVKEAVHKLPEKLREIIILYYYENLKVSEISEITGLSDENIKSRLFRARKKLKEDLQDMQPF